MAVISDKHKEVDEQFTGNSTVPSTIPFFIPYNNVLKSAVHFKGKIFITLARRGSGIPSTLNYVPDDLPVGSSPLLRPYPDFKTNELHVSIKRFSYHF